jgi:cobalt-zinc-cadmium efflux system protein
MEEKHHHHSHDHGHGHIHSRELKGRNLLFAFVLNLFITVAEVIGGLLSNSIALLSDAVHNLGDTIAVLIAYIANIIGKRNANERKTFGYRRIEILAALINSLVLIAIIFYLFFEAIKRFQSPEPIRGALMFWVALAGLIANLVAVLLLRKDSSHNLNIRSAYLHLLGDTISSVAVIAGSLLIYFFNVTWVDPVITIIIGIYILKESYRVLKQTVDILMQSTPSSINLQEVVKEMAKRKGIGNVHHVHAWQLSDTQIHFECHVDLLEDLPLSKADILRREVEAELFRKFAITHVTIQFEYNCCDEKALIHKLKKESRP